MWELSTPDSASTINTLAELFAQAWKSLLIIKRADKVTNKNADIAGASRRVPRFA
jgi:hypothetical protein